MGPGSAAFARVAAVAGMVAATAVAVLSLGALGVLGPLGDVIAGGDRSVVDEASATADRDAAAIVAGPSRGAASAPAPIRLTARRIPQPGAAPRPGSIPVPPPRGGGDPPRGTPGPSPESGPTPAAPIPLEPVPPPDEPRPDPRVVGGAADGLENATKDAPAPVRDTVKTVADTVRQTCGQLPACP